MTARQASDEWPELEPATIQRALDGDRSAFETLYRHYRGVVRGAVAARLRMWPRLPVALEDVLSEVWIQMLANDRKLLRYYDPKRGPFGYFLRVVAATRTSSVLRRHSSRDQLPPPEEQDEQLERVMMQRDFIEALWSRVQPLIKDVDRELFVRVIVMGAETKEVAPALGLTQNAAYQRIARLRTRLGQAATQLLTDQGQRAPSRPEKLQVLLTQVLVTAALLGGQQASASQQDRIGVSPAGPKP